MKFFHSHLAVISDLLGAHYPMSAPIEIPEGTTIPLSPFSCDLYTKTSQSFKVLVCVRACVHACVSAGEKSSQQCRLTFKPCLFPPTFQSRQLPGPMSTHRLGHKNEATHLSSSELTLVSVGREVSLNLNHQLHVSQTQLHRTHQPMNTS